MTTEQMTAEVANVITTPEAASILGIQAESVQANCRRGTYQTARQSGGIWLIHRAEIEALLPDDATWTVNTDDLGWDETPGITITINRAPATVSQRQWEELAEWVESNCDTDTATYYFD